MLSEAKPCAVCETPFTPVRRAGGRWSETCGKTHCRSVLSARHEKVKAALAKGIETQQRQRRDRLRALTAKKFGELTDREVAILSFGKDIGYQDGYNAAVRGKGVAA